MIRIAPERARRMALAAQGFATAKPGGAVDRRHFRKVFRTIGLLQLDSVNVLERSHYLPVFARLGGYDRRRLDTFTTDATEVFEYWGHEASLLPVETYPLWRFRMEGVKPWGRVVSLEKEHPGYIESVYEEIATHGPMTVSDLADPGMRTGPWWGYGRGKIALEWLFVTGRVTGWRNGSFGRVYDLPERVIPAHLLEAPAPSREEAYRTLLLEAAVHYGIGTAGDLVDYYRLHGPTARPILEQLAAEGLLRRCEVAGWRGPVYAHPRARTPHRPAGTALLSPFDPLVWNRDRAERIFGFRYRIEIYVPEPQRIHGYYVLPFLFDGELVARVDLKSERRNGVLAVKSAFIEDGREPARVAGALAAELAAMAQWLGLDDISVAQRGSLATELKAALG